MEKYYLILSEGEYSDYTPIYYVGDKKITQEELDKKGKDIGDIVIKEWEELPTRPHVCKSDFCYHPSGQARDYPEKYNPNDPKKWISYSPNASEWMTKMDEWILSQGFKKLPDNIPEINTSYSDFPSNQE